MMSTKERLVFKMLLDACSDFCARYNDGKPKYKQHYLQMAMALEAAGVGQREGLAKTINTLNESGATIVVANTSTITTPAPTEQKQGETNIDPSNTTAAGAD